MTENPYMRDYLLEDLKQQVPVNKKPTTVGPTGLTAQDPAQTLLPIESPNLGSVTPWAAETPEPPTPAPTQTPTTTTPPPTTYSGAGQAGGVGLEGFNLGRAQDPKTSAKDAFAQAWGQAQAAPPGEDKAALGAWFDQNIRPSMEANGMTINWVDGDKMNFTSPQGTYTVDWYRGAGAPGGAGAWQVDDGSGFDNTGSPYAPTGVDAEAGLNDLLANQSVNSDINSAITTLLGQGFQRQQILEALQALVGGAG